jgi:Spy/CpxP family protein refolding chaperone
MHRKLIIVMAVVMSIIAAAVAAPQDSCRTEMAKGEKMAKELGLSTQQKAQFKDLHREMREAHNDQIDKMKALLEKSKEELLKPAPSKDILYGYAREMGELHRVMAEKEAEHLLKVKAVLTPDQFVKLLSRDFKHDKGHRHPSHGMDD